jgi:hypothetical protein
MKLAQSTIDRPTSPAALTCSICPFARHLDGNRYVCTVSETTADVVRGHWESKASCHEAIAQAEAEKAAQAPIAQTEAPAPATPKSATPSTTAPATLSGEKPAPAPTPAAIGENDDSPPNRGDNGRGRVQPIATKKLLPLIVPISRIRSDIPASNFDPNELEILGELMLSIGGFVVPPVLVRDSGGYRVVSGHLQFHAAVLAKQLNPRAGETIPAIVLEPENQATALNQLKRLKFAA